MIDVNHSLYRLSDSINWVGLEEDLGAILGSVYRPAVRLVCATVYLQSFFDLSSDEVIKKWSLCRYARYFCGGSISLNDTTCFPMPPRVLDTLAGQLNSEAHNVMIEALLAASIESDDCQFDIPLTVH